MKKLNVHRILKIVIYYAMMIIILSFSVSLAFRPSRDFCHIMIAYQTAPAKPCLPAGRPYPIGQVHIVELRIMP